MSDGTETGIPMSEENQPKTFTQDELDSIISERLKRQEREKFGDYADLKKRAGETATLEQRFGQLETELATTRAGALRASVAAAHGISTKKGEKGEPSDADLFLTGSDEATLTAQAERLAGRAADQKQQGNVAPKEGTTTTTTTGTANQELREFAKDLFGKTD